MAVIEYLGYRLIAMTCLPINKNSIQLGTPDQGHNFHYNDQVRQKKVVEEEGIGVFVNISQGIGLKAGASW
jgi:hypothetical protein